VALTVIGIIYSPWGKRSGAHINPSVTLRSQDSQDSTDYSRAASENEKVSPHERSALDSRQWARVRRQLDAYLSNELLVEKLRE